MRIISGNLKGRSLKFPDNIRPTTQKVRKAIFDILGDSVSGSRVLDLFAGSGALGLEAVSYGAKEVVFVDNSFVCLRFIENNLKSLGFTSYHLYKSDSLQMIDLFNKKSVLFDFIFLDPPYRQDYAKNSLLRIGAYDILEPLGLLVIEHHKKEELPEAQGGLIIYKRKSYGDTILSFYKAA